MARFDKVGVRWLIFGFGLAGALTLGLYTACREEFFGGFLLGGALFGLNAELFVSGEPAAPGEPKP